MSFYLETKLIKFGPLTFCHLCYLILEYLLFESRVYALTCPLINGGGGAMVILFLVLILMGLN